MGTNESLKAPGDLPLQETDKTKTACMQEESPEVAESNEYFEQYKALHADELEEMCRLPEDMQAPEQESAPDEPAGAQTPENAPAAEQGAAEQAEQSNAEKKDDVAGGEEQ